MPWTISDPPPPAINWTDAEIARCVEAANAVLEETEDEEQAIFACIRAAGKSKKDEVRPMEHKQIPFEITAIDAVGRTIEGYAAVFGNIDGVGDIIHPGAFRKTLTERGNRIKFLWQHNPGEPLGKIMDAREDGRGLFIKAVVSDTAKGRDVLALLKDNAIDGMSIGYDAIPGGTSYETMDGMNIRNLREIRLHECSLVTFPANEKATVTAVKSDEEKAGRVISGRNKTRLMKACRDGKKALDDIEALLREAGYDMEIEVEPGDDEDEVASKNIYNLTLNIPSGESAKEDKATLSALSKQSGKEAVEDIEVKSETDERAAVEHEAGSQEAPTSSDVEHLLRLVKINRSKLDLLEVNDDYVERGEGAQPEPV